MGMRIRLVALIGSLIICLGILLSLNDQNSNSTLQRTKERNQTNIRLKSNYENEILDHKNEVLDQVSGEYAHPDDFEIELPLEELDKEDEVSEDDIENSKSSNKPSTSLPERFQDFNLNSKFPNSKAFLPFTCPISNQSNMIKRSTLWRGTGAEVKRILKRSIKSSLFATQRRNENTGGIIGKQEDEVPFRILVLGGSVSNCRGVEIKDCWHSHLLTWFQGSLPLEYDPMISPPSIPSLSSLDTIKFRDTRSHETPPSALKRIRRAVAASLPKKKSKPNRMKIPSRGKIKTRLINSSKSATGSAFFAYCFPEEMKIRRKDVEWGAGPDLVVLEFAVNDVFPLDIVAKRNFETLLLRLRSMKSKPAIILLESASLLLARTTEAANVELMHIEVAQSQDIPIISASAALFRSPIDYQLVNSSTTESLFLPDKHHPNEAGHKILGDMLTNYLAEEACIIQEDLIQVSHTRLLLEGGEDIIDPRIDLIQRKDEVIKDLPTVSIFGEEEGNSLFGNTSVCLQIGHADSKVKPTSNSGWTQYAWSRDKQYLTATTPGSIITFAVEVNSGGSILVDYLRSRSFHLGDALVFLDGNRETGIQLSGWWDLGWSVGVPETVFSKVSPGIHSVSFELLPAAQSHHPLHETAFRLIGLITT